MSIRDCDTVHQRLLNIEDVKQTVGEMLTKHFNLVPDEIKTVIVGTTTIHTIDTHMQFLLDLSLGSTIKVELEPLVLPEKKPPKPEQKNAFDVLRAMQLKRDHLPPPR